MQKHPSSLNTLATLMLPGLLAGCATSAQPCSPVQYVTVISPTTATADHMAVAPGDQTKFTASSNPAATSANNSCPIPQVVRLLTPDWTSSDNINVTISSAQDSTNGVATCKSATAAPVILTASQNSKVLGTAKLTCK